MTAHVVPADGGGWTVRKEANGVRPNGASSSQSFARRRDAEAFAKDMVREQGGGEVVLHTPSGRIREVDTVVPESTTGS
jgi:hypothetical protein